MKWLAKELCIVLQAFSVVFVSAIAGALDAHKVEIWPSVISGLVAGFLMWRLK